MTMRWLAPWVVIVASGLLPMVDGVAQSQPSAVTVRQLIASWDLLTPMERHVLWPWLFTAIEQEPDPRIRRALAQDFDLKRSRLTADVTQPSILPEEAAQTVTARHSFDRLLTHRHDHQLSEADIRERIHALQLDPIQPEIALGQGMELAGSIDQIEDRTAQDALRRLLEDRLVHLQEGLPEM